MKKLVMIAGATAMALGTAGCGNDTPAENEVEKQAEAIDEAYKADARVEDAFAQNAPDAKAQEDKADALRKQGDEIQDHLKTEADELGSDTRRMEKEGVPPPG